MIQPIYLAQNRRNEILTFKNHTSDISKTPKSSENVDFEKKLLSQNQSLVNISALFLVGFFIKLGFDIATKKMSKPDLLNSKVVKSFESLKNDTSVPTLDKCTSINTNLKKILERQIAHLKAGTNIINDTGNPTASNRLLLCGPAGVGKSFFAKIFAKSLDAHYKEVLYSDFNSRWIGEHLTNLTSIFENTLCEAKSNPNKKYVLVFNEIDTLLNPIQKLTSSGNNSNYGAFKIEERSVFLNYLEDLKNKAPNVTIIGTTNISPQTKNLDQAALSRFQNIIEVPYPDKDCIYEALKINLKGLPNIEKFLEINKKELTNLVNKLVDRKCSFRNIEYIANEAKNIHMEEKIKNKNSMFCIEHLRKAETNLKYSEGELEYK